MHRLRQITRAALQEFGLILLVLGIRFLFATCRVTVHMHSPKTCPYEPGRPERFLFCIWHDHIMAVVFGGRCRYMAALVSQHRDGGILSGAMERQGITPIRGSSSRGAVAAMREMLEAIRDYDVGITPDGPRGPRREVKDGIIFLASKTGRPVIPCSARATRAWRIQGRWTDLLVPKPFSDVVVVGGEPLDIPKGTNRREFPRYVELLQERMQLVEQQIHDVPVGQLPNWHRDPEDVARAA